MNKSPLSEMIRLSKTIINLAIDTSDDRTRHLTDHIYHVVTFSALTLIHLINTSNKKIQTTTNHDIADLDALILKLVAWLRSIGLPCHVSHLLGDVVLTQFEKFRKPPPPGGRVTQDVDMSRGRSAAHPSANTAGTRAADGNLPASSFLAANVGGMPQADAPQFPFLDMISSELFGMDADVAMWPQWDQIASHMDHCV
jgi:hypothetical protein